MTARALAKRAVRLGANQKVDERIVDSGSDFARKFDETVDRAVLDEIDRRVRAT